MKDSEIYEEAAKNIFSGKSFYCCSAIDHIAFNFLLTRSESLIEFEENFKYLFHPLETRGFLQTWFWPGLVYSFCSAERKKSLEHRVLMLLLMAEIAKDEERK